MKLPYKFQGWRLKQSIPAQIPVDEHINPDVDLEEDNTVTNLPACNLTVNNWH